MQMAGANPQPERASLLGYADAIIETTQFVWVFKPKIRQLGTGRDALLRVRVGKKCPRTGADARERVPPSVRP